MAAVRDPPACDLAMVVAAPLQGAAQPARPAHDAAVGDAAEAAARTALADGGGAAGGADRGIEAARRFLMPRCGSDANLRQSHA